uniref:Uncharacterized protein n=1 Tax=Timema shepardi TaxID=629360 RepID=A0A7R9B279_TIMSH|nr:unnamed protein product [Timema shepardi]
MEGGAETIGLSMLSKVMNNVLRVYLPEIYLNYPQSQDNLSPVFIFIIPRPDTSTPVLLCLGMKRLGHILLILSMLRLFCFAAAIQYDEEKYLEREVSKELTNWIMQMIHRSEPAMCPHKRNSELINSLLALPKVLNDAGRK